MSEIFLSYRRSDDPAATRLLQERLTAVFGERAIFYDVETIPQGEDFVTFIDRTIRECKAVLVVIGPRWLDAGDVRGRRLDQPNDPVRLEIETALRLRKKVIPVLVNDTRMPTPDALPVTIALLHRQNAAPLHTNQYFKSDMDRLIATVAQTGVRPTLAGYTAGGRSAARAISGRQIVGFLSIPLILFLVGVVVVGGLGYLALTHLPSLMSSLMPSSMGAGAPSVTLTPVLGQLVCNDQQFQVTLENGDSRAYQYHVTLSDDPAGHPWATVSGASGASGTVAAKGKQLLTLSPANTLCDDLGNQPRTVTVTVDCTPVGGGSPISPALKSTLTVIPALPQ